MTAEHIKMLLTAAGYKTQGQAAVVLGVKRETVSKWVNDHSKPEEENEERLREVQPLPGRRKEWADFLAYVDDVIHGRADGPPEVGAGSAHPQGVDAKALAEVIANDLAPVLKVNPEDLAELLAQKIGLKGLAPDLAARLLPEVRKVVEEVVAQKFKEAGQENTREAVEKALAACVERVTILLEQNSRETRSGLDALATLFQRALDAVATAFKHGLDSLGAKADGLGSEVRQLHAKAGGLENGVRQLQAQARDLGTGMLGLQAQAGAQRRESRIQFLILLATVVGFGLAILSRPAGRPIPGDGRTRAAGVMEDAASGQQQDPYGARTGIGSGVGERKVGKPMPHQPLPHQATGKCLPGETSIYGGCWQKAADQQPPCLPGYYEYGNACYLPIAATPDAPVGETPRSGQETPSRKQGDAEMAGKQQE